MRFKFHIRIMHIRCFAAKRQHAEHGTLRNRWLRTLTGACARLGKVVRLRALPRCGFNNNSLTLMGN